MITERRLGRMREILERRQPDLEVVLEDVRDPHNASAIYRSADAFGAAGITRVYHRERPPRISRLVSACTREWTRVEDFDDPAEACAALRARGLRVVAATPSEDAIPFWSLDWTQPVAMVVGHEQMGCSQEMLELCDAAVSVPMLGFCQSLNVSVAAAVLLSEAARQRERAGMYAPAWDEGRQRQLDEWVQRERPSSSARQARKARRKQDRKEARTWELQGRAGQESS